jgi:hypothetical protein
MRIAQLLLCLTLLFVAAITPEQGSATQAAKQPFVPLALQYRQRILHGMENPPRPLPSLPGAVDSANSERLDCLDSCADHTPLVPPVPCSLYDFLMCLRL